MLKHVRIASSFVALSCIVVACGADDDDTDDIGTGGSAGKGGSGGTAGKGGSSGKAGSAGKGGSAGSSSGKAGSGGSAASTGGTSTSGGTAGSTGGSTGGTAGNSVGGEGGDDSLGGQGGEGGWSAGAGGETSEAGAGGEPGTSGSGGTAGTSGSGNAGTSGAGGTAGTSGSGNAGTAGSGGTAGIAGMGGAGAGGTAGLGGAAGIAGTAGTGGVVPDTIDNPGFEQGTNSTLPTGWTATGDLAAATYSWSDSGGAHSGPGFLDLWWDSAYTVDVSQVVSPLPDGNYDLSIWHYGGAYTQQYVYVTGYDETTPANMLQQATSANSAFVEVVIPNIPVTSGQIKIGIHSVGASGNWSHFDDVSLTLSP